MPRSVVVGVLAVELGERGAGGPVARGRPGDEMVATLGDAAVLDQEHPQRSGRTGLAVPDRLAQLLLGVDPVGAAGEQEARVGDVGAQGAEPAGEAVELLGLLVAGSGGAITTGAGDPYLFQSAVAVIVGGTVFGGPGDYNRTVIGALFLALLNTVLLGNGAGAAAQQYIYGLAILASVSVYSRGRRLRDQF
mgnify:CR=1 FL=1